MNIEPIEYNGDIAIGLILRAKPGGDLNEEYLYEITNISPFRLIAVYSIFSKETLTTKVEYKSDTLFKEWNVVGFSNNYISPITKINCIIPLETTKKKSRLSFI